MSDEKETEKPAEDGGAVDEAEAPEKEGLKDTDTLPSDAETQAEKQPPEKKKKIIGLMGVEHDEGPAGSTHG